MSEGEESNPNYNVRAEHGYGKGRFIALKRKLWIENVIAEKKARYAEKPEAENDEVCIRIVDMVSIANELWCNACDLPLSLKFVEKECRYGLASVLTIRCTVCKKLTDVATSRKTDSPSFRNRFDLNYKAATAIIDGGSGESQFNCILSALGIPELTPHLLKRYEDEIGPIIEEVAINSCKEAIAHEKELTVAAEGSCLTNNPNDAQSCDDPAAHGIGDNDVIGLTASFDAAWQKRGTGRAYNSKSAHATLAGYYSKEIISYAVRSVRCAKCDHGIDQKDHDCRKNFEGSAKAMEPDMAVEMVTKNPLLEEANVRIERLVGDDDSSTIAAVRREAQHEVEKWSDLNHAKKAVSNALYVLKTSAKVRTYFTNAFVKAITKNKGNAPAVESALKNIVNHAFGEHDACDQNRLCRTLEERYTYEGLPHGRPLTDADLRTSLTNIFTRTANNASKLAPCGSTQINESFNNLVTYKHPKNRHYGGSASCNYRVAAAVCQKNIGPEYIFLVFEKLRLPVADEAKKCRAQRAQKRKARAETLKTFEYKRKRAANKKKTNCRNTAASNREGITYSTDCGFDATSVQFQDPPVFASETIENSEQATTVVFDLETSGLSKSAEICQIAAIGNSQAFNAYIVPSHGITSSASAVNGLTVVGEEMFLDDAQLSTTTLQKAISDFIAYLHNISDGKGAILVSHNGFRFDVPMLLRAVNRVGLLAELMSVVQGFCDTLPIFRRLMPQRLKEKKKFTQVALATDFIGPTASEGAHNAIRDVEILSQLMEVTSITSSVIKQESKSVRSIINSQEQAEIQNGHKLTLEPLKTVISAVMRSKMAKAGINLDILTKAFDAGGPESVRMLLAEDVGGRPRVTKQEKCLNRIIVELTRLNKK